ncbi:MAG TPA: COX15/CtaA family protein, partial [Balneolaceae bacterium]|nr:COX15/CtaA family protein [Balneolaceae bacterium]
MHSDRTSKEKSVRYWLWTGAGLIFLMLIIGGITRLTGSGLSMTNWNLVMGTIPPLDHSSWLQAFDRYKQFPEYRQLNFGMTLPQFKAIFFWEYLHRLLGRLIGLVFFIPLVWFWWRGYFDRSLKKKMSVLLGLGILQGAMGWIMVKSGLVDNPHVSHYRLAMHLTLAFILLGCCIWFALDLRDGKVIRHTPGKKQIKRWLLVIAVFFFVQIAWGAFVAGLHAGKIYNTFPLMNSRWIPSHAWSLKPVLLNLLANPGTVQWIHRIVGTLLTLVVILLWIKVQMAQTEPIIQKRALALLV